MAKLAIALYILPVLCGAQETSPLWTVESMVESIDMFSGQVSDLQSWVTEAIDTASAEVQKQEEPVNDTIQATITELEEKAEATVNKAICESEFCKLEAAADEYLTNVTRLDDEKLNSSLAPHNKVLNEIEAWKQEADDFRAKVNACRSIDPVTESDCLLVQGAPESLKVLVADREILVSTVIEVISIIIDTIALVGSSLKAVDMSKFNQAANATATCIEAWTSDSCVDA